MASDDIIQAPQSMTVPSEPKVILHLPDGRVLIRTAGYGPGNAIVVKKA